MNEDKNLRVLAMQLTSTKDFYDAHDRVRAAEIHYQYMKGKDRSKTNHYHPCTSILIEGLKKLNAHDVLRDWDTARMKVDNSF